MSNLQAQKMDENGFIITIEGKSGLASQSPNNWRTAGEAGVMVMGIFKGRTSPDDNGKENYLIESIEAGRSYDKEGNELPFEAGTTVLLYSSVNLDKGFETVKKGDTVIVEYVESFKMTKGLGRGKYRHIYTVKVKPAAVAASA